MYIWTLLSSYHWKYSWFLLFYIDNAVMDPDEVRHRRSLRRAARRRQSRSSALRFSQNPRFNTPYHTRHHHYNNLAWSLGSRMSSSSRVVMTPCMQAISSSNRICSVLINTVQFSFFSIQCSILKFSLLIFML